MAGHIGGDCGVVCAGEEGVGEVVKKTTYELLCTRKDSDLSTVWAGGTLEDCKTELEGCKKDIPGWDRHTWRIVRIIRKTILTDGGK